MGSQRLAEAVYCVFQRLRRCRVSSESFLKAGWIAAEAEKVDTEGMKKGGDEHDQCRTAPEVRKAVQSVFAPSAIGRTHQEGTRKRGCPPRVLLDRCQNDSFWKKDKQEVSGTRGIRWNGWINGGGRDMAERAGAGVTELARHLHRHRPAIFGVRKGESSNLVW